MKCGLEIHQRICSRKLFCECSAVVKKEFSHSIKRILHPVKGESGLLDKAVLFESLRKRTFTYKFNDFNTCLVETDSEPPHEINKEALITALSLARHFKMFIPDEIHVMRKTVIDGSNTSGFQRTMVIGLGTKDSVIKTAEGNVRIKELDLEEESARIISKDGEYSINSLGIPLIELSTYPDIKSPEQAYEVALAIGEILRLTGKAQRGIGTIRQDVNISVPGGARVEIKGFQELKELPELIRLEVERQKSLIKLKNELTGYEIRRVNLTKFFKKSGKKVIGLVLPGFKGLLSRKLNEKKTLGNELADYARAMGVGGIIHEDEDLAKYDLVEEFAVARNELALDESDLLLIIKGDDENLINKALDFVEERVYLLNDKVPSETRVAGKDGVSSYARPMPGGERMYPETDIPLIIPPTDIPEVETKSEREKELKSLGLTDDLISQLVLHPRFSLFRELVKLNVKPLLIARLLVDVPKYVKKHYHKDVSVLADSHFREIVNLLSDNKILFEAVPEIIAKICDSPDASVPAVAEKYRILSRDELKRVIMKVRKNNKGLSSRALMGIVMKEVRGRAKGSEVMKLL